MTKPKTDYEMKRDEAAITLCAPILRSMVSRGFALEQAVKMSDFGAAYERERAEKLVKALEILNARPCSAKVGCPCCVSGEALAEYKGEVE